MWNEKTFAAERLNIAADVEKWIVEASKLPYSPSTVCFLRSILVELSNVAGNVTAGEYALVSYTELGNLFLTFDECCYGAIEDEEFKKLEEELRNASKKEPLCDNSENS